MIIVVVALSATTINPVLLAQNFVTGGLAAQPLSTSNPDVRLEFTPYKEDVWTSILLRANGDATAIRYLRYPYTVIEVRTGLLTKTKLDQLLAKTRQPAFVEALKVGTFGLAQNGEFLQDFPIAFNLFLSFSSDKHKGASGIEHYAPPAIREFISELLSTTKQLHEAPRAHSYLRIQRVGSERLKLLRREGRLRITTLQNLPPEIQTLLNKAITLEGDFQSLSDTQYKLLRQYDIFIKDAIGYELILFSSQSKNSPQPK